MTLLHIAIITAGGAGMFCGSCMHDNTWARSLMDAGAEVSLIPTYTPIRVDERDVSDAHVFMGGVNVYMDHRSRLWRRLPRFLTRPFDHPRFLRLISRLSISNDAAELGDLTLDMLAGESGPLVREVEELANYLAHHLKPDVVVFSNSLLVGALRRLKEQFSGPVFCTLQGDDVFTDGLAESHKQPVLDAISERAQQFDGFITHSRFYRDYMSSYLQLPLERFHVTPLGIDLTGHDGVPKARRSSQPLTIGYFARVAPEKGLHHLVDAALLLHKRRPGEFRIKAGGYLNPQHRGYFETVRKTAQPLGNAFEYVGSPATLMDKVVYYKSLDLLSVPTEFLEPKGLYVLEALANGVPVIQPAHGAFPEIIESTGGGLLCEPRAPAALAETIEHFLDNPELQQSLAVTGQQHVHEHFHPGRMAQVTLDVFSSSIESRIPLDAPAD